MPRNRTPTAKAHVSGADIRNPSRFKGRRPVGSRPIGPPYERMTREQAAIWRELALSMPWLRSHHRILLRQACVLAARMDSDEGMGLSAHRCLTGIMAKLGGTPTDDSKVPRDDDDAPDPTDRFFGGRPN